MLLCDPGTKDARWGGAGGCEVEDEDQGAAGSSSVHPFKGKEWTAEDCVHKAPDAHTRSG